MWKIELPFLFTVSLGVNEYCTGHYKEIFLTRCQVPSALGQTTLLHSKHAMEVTDDVLMNLGAFRQVYLGNQACEITVSFSLPIHLSGSFLIAF